jgi:hypothetical protein
MATINLAASSTSLVNASIVKLDVVESVEQMTLIAAVAITAGQHLAIDATGKFTQGDSAALATAKSYGIATSSVPAGYPVTAVAKGVLNGFNLTAQAYGAPIYCNPTGAIGDAAGTESRVIGLVVPVRSQVPGTAPAKALRVSM